MAKLIGLFRRRDRDRRRRRVPVERTIDVVTEIVLVTDHATTVLS